MDSKDLLQRLTDAVARGLEARSAFYASIGLEDGQRLGPPAAPAMIRRLETLVGRALPPSYKAFLELHDGWRMADAVTDLLPVGEMLGGERAERVKGWQREAAKWGDSVGADGLVIGYSDISQSRILLDPSGTRADGEWRLLERYKDEEVAYDSFLDWLEQSASDFVKIAGPEPDVDDEDGDGDRPDGAFRGGL